MRPRMRERYTLFASLTCLLMAAAFQPLFAQTGFELTVKKPKPYEERVLKAEKTPTDKKIKQPKHFFQNLTTHYNYYFNANNKLNEVIERAKYSHKDDYSQLLSFYNYSLDVTAGDEMELDSVIYKSQTGIVMHDLRSDWVDNLYLLWGAAHFFQKQFDSAYLMFQFINTAFADKEKDGYYKYIGSRMDGNNAQSISTKENNSLTRRIFSTSPSRNDALLWQVRTLIELDNLTDAGSMLITLKNDPSFPERLQDNLEEVQAYWFYKQKIWDSSAFHLLRALDVARNKQERGRWEYLAGQMFVKAGKMEEAQKAFAKAVGHGTDPVMDVYARLNLVRTNQSGGENYVDQNIAALVKMARKERFSEYRDVIYYMAAQMEMDRGHLAAAQDFLLKAAHYNNGNLSPRSNAFLLIADLAYEQKKYLQAAPFYDSVQIGDLKDEEIKRVEQRKNTLAKLVVSSQVISRQDSLQHLASLSEEERKAYITKLVKKLRKQQGLSDESTSPSAGNANPFNNPAPADLFSNESKSGEWYFYNNSLKTGGAAQFKQVWGNRPNADNWRRFAQVSNQLQAKLPGGNPRSLPSTPGAPGTTAEDNSPSFATLLAKIPLTPQALQVSNDSINTALFNLGTLYLNEMEDYASAIENFEKLRSRDPGHPKMNEIVFDLYFAYKKSGDAAKAAEMKNLLTSHFGASRFAAIVNTGKDPDLAAKNAPEATKDYEAIYDMFIEGHFEEAEAAKKKADSTYQTNHWEPQLLYIEAVYHIRQREDSLARGILQTLITQDPSAPLSAKAKNLLDVLSRRQQIEEELTRLQIERPKEDTAQVSPPPAPVTEPVVLGPAVKRDSVLTQNKKEVAVNPVPQKPLGQPVQKPIVVEQQSHTVYRFEPSLNHYAVIILNKVDPVFSGETKNAFNRFDQEKYYNQPLAIQSVDIDPDHRLVLVGTFPSAQEALDYVQQARRLAPTEIIPWLKPDKYSFSIISNGNLEVLQNLKDLEQYRKFLEQNLPGKF
ncbi:MAG: type IX secretion system periplasmic lipoprotein PorW/SprE [Flavisolibacter sp.]